MLPMKPFSKNRTHNVSKEAYWRGVMISKFASLEQLRLKLSSDFDPYWVLYTFGLVLHVSCVIKSLESTYHSEVPL